MEYKPGRTNVADDPLSRYSAAVLSILTRRRAAAQAATAPAPTAASPPKPAEAGELPEPATLGEPPMRPQPGEGGGGGGVPASPLAAQVPTSPDATDTGPELSLMSHMIREGYAPDAWFANPHHTRGLSLNAEGFWTRPHPGRAGPEDPMIQIAQLPCAEEIDFPRTP
jgi:hypothetical protein